MYRLFSACTKQAKANVRRWWWGVGRVLLLLRWRRSAAPKTGKTGSTAPKTEKTGSRGALAPGFQNRKKTGKNREKPGNRKNREPPQKPGLPVKPGGYLLECNLEILPRHAIVREYSGHLACEECEVSV